MIRWIGNRFAMITALLVLFYLFLPVAYTFAFSFNNYKKSNISWNPEGSPTLDHWQNPCGPAGICDALTTSITVGGIATLVATFLGTLLAFALVRYRFKGRGVGNILVFIPMAGRSSCGPVCRFVQFVLEGHLPARPARHCVSCPAVVLAVVRRLHHHELRLR